MRFMNQDQNILRSFTISVKFPEKALPVTQLNMPGEIS